VEKNNTNMFIVAIVAIIGMIFLFSGQKIVVQGVPINTISGNQGNSENLVGQAYKMEPKIKNNLAIIKSFGQFIELEEFSIPLKSYELENIILNKEYAKNSEIKIDTVDKVGAMSFNGVINLLDSNFLVRLILIDNNDDEYLIYELYDAISINDELTELTLENVCEETCLLSSIKPKYIKLQVMNAKLLLNSINYVSEDLSKITMDKKAEQIEYKITQITKNQNSWIAGNTGISELSYQEKKKLFGNPEYLPNLQGFEYYKGGVFKFESDKSSQNKENKIINSNIKDNQIRTAEINILSSPTGAYVFINDMDENVGQTPIVIDNLQPGINKIKLYKSGYYTYVNNINISDNNALELNIALQSFISNNNMIFPAQFNLKDFHGTNWDTPIKDQGSCGSCYAFAAVASIENNLNLYYNQHLDYDLSEQHPVSCRGVNGCEGGSPSGVLTFSRDYGIVDENCFPYQAEEIPCNELCDSPDLSIKINEQQYMSYYNNANSVQTIKHELMTCGALTSTIYSWHHAMSLIGWIPNRDDPEHTVWIFKNSWGDNWGDEGYAQLSFEGDDFSESTNSAMIINPFYVENIDFLEILCEDQDGDNYCNWGITQEMPDSCPSNCLPKKDSDDSNSRLGPYVSDTDFRSQSLGNHTEPYEMVNNTIPQIR